MLIKSPLASVHPRARGEHPAVIVSNLSSTGSSPRSRGTQMPVFDDLTVLRFIPALAGNTSPTTSRTAPTTVHPRARGEHGVAPAAAGCGSGSSPRSRGTLDHLAATVLRFIAGNTSPTTSRTAPTTVHPRARGEHGVAPAAAGCGSGSSPRSRGTLDHLPRCQPDVRFILALAGNTESLDSFSVRFTVHPRARGEHGRRSISVVIAAGSSPRSRGTRASSVRDGDKRRFIPALAGNTSKSCGSARAASVHPRARGEHAAAWEEMHPSLGSSPRSRGTH